ncbi:YqgE/AlgH family protein [Moraxella marmotae]|uniref:YqgE/AlgH family protein n=1 Tax=Moraxella marmotae TaxID=3344520 RepID=UPI0035F4CE67
MKSQANFTHHFLLPSTQMADDRFTDALIYLCRHNADGAWGFVVNRPLSSSVGGLLAELDLPVTAKAMQTLAMDGGPVRPDAGFVLHTGQPDYKSSFVISENVCLTTSKDILQQLAFDGLSHYLLCMGYCNWGRGQLDAEIRAGDWYVCPADLPTLFMTPFDERLKACYDKLGIDLDRLTDSFGYA